MSRRVRFILIGIAFVLFGAALTIWNWRGFLADGSFSQGGALFFPMLVFVGIAMIANEPSGRQNAYVTDTGQVRYPPPPLGVKIVLIVGFLVALGNVGLMYYLRGTR